MSTTLPELYRQHRPTSLKHVIGQDEAVKTLRIKVKKKQLPHAIMMVGPSGVGKTTLSFIIAKSVECITDVDSGDFTYINCAGQGIDMVRKLKERLNLKGLRGGARVIVLDECHKLSADAQNALLIPLENPPDHVYFILCTTEADKMLKTVKNRCMVLTLKPLGANHLLEVMRDVCGKAEIDVPSDEVLEAIAAASEGSARQALTILDQVRDLASEEEQLEAIKCPTAQAVAFDIVRGLIWQKMKWPEMAKILRLTEEDPEMVRRLIMANAGIELMKGKPSSSRAYLICITFNEPFYDSGKARLAAACYEVLSAK